MLPSGFAAFVAASILDYFVVAFVLIGFTIILLLQSRLFKRLENAISAADKSSEILETLGELIGRIKPATIDLSSVESRLKELLEGTVRLEERLQLLIDREAPVAEHARPLGLQGLIEQRLVAGGYHSVHVIGSLAGKETGEHKVPVEVMKGNVPHKGHVLLKNGKVSAERLLPIYEAFP